MLFFNSNPFIVGGLANVKIRNEKQKFTFSAGIMNTEIETEMCCSVSVRFHLRLDLVAEDRERNIEEPKLLLILGNTITSRRKEQLSP